MKRAMRVTLSQSDALSTVEVRMTKLAIPIAIGTMWQLKNNLDMKNIALFLLLLTTNQLQAMAPFKPLEWVTNPVYDVIADSLQKENVVMLLQEIRYDFRHESDGELYMYETEHQIVRVLNEDAIDDFNTYSVSDNEVLQWITLKARTLSESGKITQFNKNNIKEITDEETGDPYKIFAVDGIEVGNTVEFLSVKKKEASSFGRTYMQYSYPVLKSTYTLTSPVSLEYQLKSFNGYMAEQPKITMDSVNIYAFEGARIPALYTEPFSYRNAKRVRVEYRLNRNLDRGKYQILTWDVAAKRVYGSMYSTNEKEDKAIEKYLKGMQLRENGSLETILAVEDYLKTHVLNKENGSAETNELEYVIKNQVASDKGLTKLFVNIFDLLGVPHELVLGIERDKVRFDPDFQSWNYLDKYLIYFPELDMFMSPASDAFRVGTIPSLLTAQFALFIRPVQVGTFESAVGDVRYIPEPSCKDNYDHIYMDLSLNASLDNANMHLERCFKGLSGGSFGRILAAQDEVKRQQTLKSLSALDDFKPEYTNINILPQSTHQTAADAGFVYACDLSTPGILETAGNKILLQFGKLIGPQSELYQEEERQNEVENSFNRSYYREIRFHVPDGYKISNPEAANFEVVQTFDGDTLNAFVSTARLEGNVYSVTINEYYDILLIPKKDFEPFRKVINAAADFNKVALILEKK